MQCTMDKVINSSYSGSYCSQWKSKQKYNELAIGGDSKFELLYIDFEIISNIFYNEGGVRPPNLIQAGAVSTTGAASGVKIAIKWDIGLYECTVDQVANEPFNCTLSNPVYCPAAESNFYSSYYYYNGKFVVFEVTDIFWIDELGHQYRFGNFCQQNPVPYIVALDTNNCSIDGDPYSVFSPYLVAGSQNFNNFVTAIPPDCMYDYPDYTLNNAQIKLLEGMFLRIHFL